jgi:large subunit ribosomal protein L24
MKQEFSINLKKGDEVKVLSGKEKGKKGKVMEILPKKDYVVIEGLNIRVRFSRPKKQGEKGQRLELPGPLHISKVMLVCPYCGKTTRVTHALDDAGKKHRKCQKCSKMI